MHKIGNNTIFNSYFFPKNIDHIGELFDDSGRSQSSNDLKEKLDLIGSKIFLDTYYSCHTKTMEENFLNLY